MLSAKEIAQFFIQLAEQEPEPELLTHLHVQKLLYYAQGWSLAWNRQPLFDEPIEAWKHGPVVRCVWKEYKEYGNRPLSSEDRVVAPDESDSRLIRAVWESYKKYSATELRNMTHDESPWRESWGDRSPDDTGSETIPIDFIRDQFENEWARVAITGIMPDEVIGARDDVAAGRLHRLQDIEREIENEAL